MIAAYLKEAVDLLKMLSLEIPSMTRDGLVITGLIGKGIVEAFNNNWPILSLLFTSSIWQKKNDGQRMMVHTSKKKYTDILSTLGKVKAFIIGLLLEKNQYLILCFDDRCWEKKRD